VVSRRNYKMSDDNLIDELGRQQEPEPLSQPVATQPPIWLYLFFVATALALLIFALSAKSQDWPGFALNLATEILGALLILIVIERRLRKSELGIIKRMPQAAGRILTRAMSAKTRQSIAFVLALYSQLEAVAKPYYMPRSELEGELYSHFQEGIVLLGARGSGKTTLLYHFIQEMALNLIHNPKNNRVPVLVACSRWTRGAAENVIFGSMVSYYPVSRRTFSCLLRKGRLLCIFDSVDESINPEEQIGHINLLKNNYPDNAYIVSGRNIPTDTLDSLGFHVLNVPPLNDEERTRLLELRSNYQ
jgi:tryptophan-rich sensory protein